MTTYSKHEIEQFLLNTNNNFAASCFYNDHIDDRVTWLQAANWFQRYFADPNTGQFLFRLMEAHCVATVDTAHA